MATSPPNDLGVLLALCTDAAAPPFALKDREGNAVTWIALNNAAWQASFVTPSIGRAEFLSLTAVGVIAGAGTALLRAQMGRNDVQNTGTIYRYQSMRVVRGDDGNSYTAVTIAAADLIATDDNTKRQDLLLQTTDTRVAGSIRLIAKWGQAAQAGDFLFVAGSIAMGNV